MSRPAFRSLLLPCAALVAGLLALLAVPARAATAEQPDVPYVPTPPAVVDAMLGIANVGPRDFVVDLGSGDGRIIIAAAKERGARGFGVDIDGALVNAARDEARKQGVADRVEFLEENLFTTDIGRASVVTLYLLHGVLMQLRPRFLETLKPGTRVVSHDFAMEGWQPDARVTVPVPDKPYGPPTSEVYLWIIPANAAGAWRWRSAVGGPAVDYELTLTQTFQMLDGRFSVGGKPGRLESGKVRGDEIRFILTAEIGGRARRHEFTGRVSGDTMSGKVSLDGGQHDWEATRTRRGRINQYSDR